MLLTLLTLVALAAPLDAPPLPGEPLGAWQALEDAELYDPLAADEAVELALANNGQLAARLADVDRARGARLSARALPNPSAELVLYEDERAGLSAVEAEYAVSDALLAPLRARPADMDLEVARLGAAVERARLAFEVREAVLRAQAVERRYETAMRAVDGWAAAAETSRALFEAGNVPELDVAVQEAEYERARVGLAAVELELVAAREHLARLMGGPTSRPLAPIPDLGVLDLPDDLEERAVAASLELRALDARVQGATAARTAALVDAAVPGLGVFAGSERHGSSWTVEAGVHLQVPLFAIGRGRIVSLDAERSAQREQRDQVEIEVRSAAREARARLISAHDRAQHFAEVVLPARERVSRQTLLQYNAMQVSIFQLLEARRSELEARATLADLQAERWTAHAALEALLQGVRVDAPGITQPETSAAAAAGGH